MSDSIISVKGLGKRYRIRHQAERSPYNSLRDVIARKVKGLFGHRPPATGHQQSTEDFWALKDVSFEIKQGDVVGIVGRNGAGKSTLLKILSRITEPTEGEIRIRGRVASLLEVGTGFHAELSGRENIFLNGAILGMSRTEIRQKFDEIVAFSGVEKFLDTPVKRFSSGMYVRLAFAVAAHLEPEILIVDEVLAVGDAEFQQKCLGKMQDVAGHGRTVLFVSHNMAAVNRLCRMGILMHKGTVAARGDIAAVAAQYLQSDTGDNTRYIPDPAHLPGNENVVLLALIVVGKDGTTGPNFVNSTSLKVEITYRILKPIRGLRIGFHLHGADGTIVFNATDTDTSIGVDGERSQQSAVYTSTCVIPGNLLNRGQYSITVGSDSPTCVNFYCDNVVSFFLLPDGGRDDREDNRPGLIRPSLTWEITRAAQDQFAINSLH